MCKIPGIPNLRGQLVAPIFPAITCQEAIICVDLEGWLRNPVDAKAMYYSYLYVSRKTITLLSLNKCKHYDWKMITRVFSTFTQMSTIFLTTVGENIDFGIEKSHNILKRTYVKMILFDIIKCY